MTTMTTSTDSLTLAEVDEVLAHNAAKLRREVGDYRSRDITLLLCDAWLDVRLKLTDDRSAT